MASIIVPINIPYESLWLFRFFQIIENFIGHFFANTFPRKSFFGFYSVKNFLLGLFLLGRIDRFFLFLEPQAGRCIDCKTLVLRRLSFLLFLLRERRKGSRKKNNRQKYFLTVH